MKKIWITMLKKHEGGAQQLMSTLGKYGLQTSGHFWENNLEKMMWMGGREPLLDKDVAAWIVAANAEDLEDREVLYGLSLLSITVQAKRGHGFPLIIAYGDKAPEIENLPTSLKHAQILGANSATIGAKLVALANKPFKPAESDYRMDVYGIPGLGLWFEVGPANHSWKGAMFGVAGGDSDVNAHGVGAMGELPRDKMILNYPMKGLKLSLGEAEYNAWAVKNEMDENSSYYLRVSGMPESALFGEFSEDDNAEAFVVKLV